MGLGSENREKREKRAQGLVGWLDFWTGIGVYEDYQHSEREVSTFTLLLTISLTTIYLTFI